MNRSIFAITIISLVFLFPACDRKPYVEHKLKFENTGKECSQLDRTFKMTSNFGGERFEFQKCLQASFVAQEMGVFRKGDTVVVRLTNPKVEEDKVFQLTLDIDSYPKYNFITIDDETYTIVPALNK